MRNLSHPQRTSPVLLAVSPGRFPEFDLRVTAGALASFWTALVERLREARARAVRRADARDTYRLMRDLDARTLRDLGIHRSELYSLALETHGELQATRRLRSRAPDFPSNLTPSQGVFNESRY